MIRIDLIIYKIISLFYFSSYSPTNPFQPLCSFPSEISLNVHVRAFYTASTNPFSRSRSPFCNPCVLFFLFQRALCCFPGFSNPGTASRKGKIPKPLLAGVDSTGTSSTASSKSRLLDDSSGSVGDVMSPSIIEFASAAARLKGTISRLSDGGSSKPTEDMMLLEKQGRSSQRQRMTADGGGEPRRAGSLPPSSLPRPPRTLKTTSANSRYCRLSDSETRKKSDPGPGTLDASSPTSGSNSGGTKAAMRDSGNCSSIEYGRFDASAIAVKTSRSKKKNAMESFITNSSLKKSSTGSGGGSNSGSGHEYERLQPDTIVSNSGRKKSLIGSSTYASSELTVKHREVQSRSFIPPPSSSPFRTRIGEYGRLSDGESSSAAVAIKSGSNTLRKQTTGSGSSRGQSTGSIVSSKSGGARDSGGTASSEASTVSLPPVKARSIPRPSNYRIQF